MRRIIPEISSLAILCLIYFYFAGCGVKSQAKPEWLALAPGTLALTDQNYFLIVYPSFTSFNDAIEKSKNELAAKIYNTVTEYLSRLQMDTLSELNATMRDVLAKRIKQTGDALKPYIEVKEKYQEPRPKKFYVLAGIDAEQVFRQISQVLEGFYDPNYLLQTLQESEAIYRVKVETRYDEAITPKLVENGCLIDNSRYYASVVGTSSIISQSSVKSLSGPLWTVKGQYVVTIKGKKGDIIKRLNGTISQGTANSLTEALNKAVAQSSVDLTNFAENIESIKSSIETYLKEQITKLLKQSDEPTRLNYANALQAFEAKDYPNTMIYLERCSIYSKEFPKAIILYLRAKSKLGSVNIPKV